MRKLKSLQYFSKMQPFFKDESILYTLCDHYKEVNFRYISYKSSVLAIFQFKEVPFLRFKLLAFLSLVAQAISPLRQHSMKKQGILAANREAHWKLTLFSWYICLKEIEPNFRSNQDFFKRSKSICERKLKARASYSSTGGPISLLFSAGHSVCEGKTGVQEVSNGTWPSQALPFTGTAAMGCSLNMQLWTVPQDLQ